MLMDVLAAGDSPSRVINIVSPKFKHATINFDDLMMQNGYAGKAAYAQSKLAIILFSRELARRLRGTAN